MEELHFDIQFPDGRQERSIVQSARAIIGSGAHCDVRLPGDQAAFEHVVIEMLADGARMQRLAASPRSMLDGSAFMVASLGTSATLTIGSTSLRIERRTATESAPQNKLGIGVLAKASLILLLASSIAFISNLPKDEVGPSSAKLPELFPARAIECPRLDPAEAKAVAEDTRAIADGARERSPFEPREAIAAVRAYDLAEACFRASGDVATADDVAAIAREIEEDTRVELRARRVRLERMLSVKDNEIARQDVVVLRALTEGHRGEYVTWLAAVEHDLKNQKVEKR